MGSYSDPGLKEKCRGAPTESDSLDQEQVEKVESKILRMNVQIEEI